MKKKTKAASTIVLNYNGVPLLKKYLPSIIKASEHNNKDNEVIVVDNNSTENDVEYLRKNFPSVRVLPLKTNKITAGLNEGVKIAKNDIVVLLNNDMEAKEDYLDYLVPHFDNKNIFAVAPFCDWKTKGAYPTVPICEFLFGVFRTVGVYDYGNGAVEAKEAVDIVGTGAGALDKKKFLEIGGFDEIYYPAYFEDIALGYEAIKRGWRLLIEPRSLMHHEAHATMKSLFKKQKLSWMQNKNRFIFTWIHVTDKKMIFSHIVSLPIVLFLGLITRGPSFVLSFFSAIMKLPKILKRRKREKREAKISDKEACRRANINIVYLDAKLIKNRISRLFKK